MAIDVLRFNELKRSINDYKCVTSSYMACSRAITTGCDAVAACASTNNPYSAGFCGKFGYWCGGCAGVICSTNLFPSLPGTPTGFSVCDTSTNFNGGAACSWVVPATARLVRFQIWGAGAPSSGVICCGVSPHGGTGSYASVIIPAVPGCEYKICSGCSWWPGALCVPNGTDISIYPGCASYVQGFGLCNFCAEGGEASLYNWLQRHHYCTPTMVLSCIAYPVQGMCDLCVGAVPGGACICQNSWICTQVSTIACFTFPANAFGTTIGGATQMWFTNYISACRTYYGCNTTSIAQSDPSYRVYGLPGFLSSLCFDPQGLCCVRIGQSPVYPFNSTGLFVCKNTGGSCCGGCQCGAAAGCLICGYGTAYPGMGGYGVVSNGGNCVAGAPGKMGMVCVQYV